ncbi:MAG: hypothetical protein RLY30_904 [Pseudomonadota bacterium]|jgi:uncharacterized membrane protein YgdD (TMEM256/DUF423 family)
MMSVYHTRVFLGLAGFYGATAVMLAAASSHVFASLPAHQLQWLNTAIQFQLWHSLALLGCASLVNFTLFRAGAAIAGVCFALGMFGFCGGLYGLALTGSAPWGAVTPIGGFLMIVGWLALLWAALRRPKGETG